MGILEFLFRWLVGVWAGALLGFGAVVAPALFAVLPPGDAGAVVRRVIPALDALGLGAVAAAVAIGFVLEGLPVGRARLRIAALAAAALCAGVSAGLVTPRLAALRAEAGDQISQLPRTDPVRRSFGRLHGVSTGLMLGQLLFASAALAFPPVRRRAAP